MFEVATKHMAHRVGGPIGLASAFRVLIRVRVCKRPIRVGKKARL